MDTSREERTEYILAHTAHRPVPLPAGAWAQQQVWQDLLFSHWSAEPALMQSLLPQGMVTDTFDGKAWLTISPFKMRNVRARLLPPIPTAANFLEMNMRTYVLVNGKPGIWFFSLDASSLLAALAARAGTAAP